MPHCHLNFYSCWHFLTIQTMDPKMYEEIFNYKTQGIYPFDIKKEQKYVIRRRSNNFQVDGKQTTLSDIHILTVRYRSIPRLDTKLILVNKLY